MIDEGATHCANCGTRLIFSEDESIEEEIPGEKILEEEAIPKKRGSRRAKKEDEETGESLRELEVIAEGERPVDEDEVEIQLEEEGEQDTPVDESADSLIDESSSFAELRPEFEDLSDMGAETEVERQSPDDHPDQLRSENRDDFSTTEKKSDDFLEGETEDDEIRVEEDGGAGGIEEPESGSDLEDDEYLLDEIEEEDQSDLTPPSIEFSENGEEEDLIELQEESEFDDLDIDQIDMDEESSFDDPGEIPVEEESRDADGYEDGNEEVEEELTSGEAEDDFFRYEDIEEEPQEENELPAESLEELKEGGESPVQDFGESDFPFDREPSKALPEEPYKRTHTQDKIAESEGPSEKPEDDVGLQEERARPPDYKTGEQLNIFDPMEKEKEDIERFLESLKKDRRSRVPDPETGELPPWAAEIKQEEQMAEEMLETEQEESLFSDEPPKGYEEEEPLEEEAEQPSPPPVQQKIYTETGGSDLFEDITKKAPVLPWIKSRLVDLVFVSLLWISALFGASLILGVSFLNIISSSIWIVVGFYLILMIQYFFLFGFFLGSTLGSRLFSQKD